MFPLYGMNDRSLVGNKIRIECALVKGILNEMRNRFRCLVLQVLPELSPQDLHHAGKKAVNLL